MSEQTARAGDTVRISYEIALEAHGSEVFAPTPWRTNLNSLAQLERFGATVEVLERADDPAPRYRVGNKNARNIYLVDGDHEVHVGVMFDPDDGPRVVEALNAFEAEMAAGRGEERMFRAADLVTEAHAALAVTKAPKHRVFRSDGPEPEGVKVLEWIDIEEPDQYPFLHRVGHGWLWSEMRNALSPVRAATPNNWSSAVASSPGRYREVI